MYESSWGGGLRPVQSHMVLDDLKYLLRRRNATGFQLWPNRHICNTKHASSNANANIAYFKMSYKKLNFNKWWWLAITMLSEHWHNPIEKLHFLFFLRNCPWKCNDKKKHWWLGKERYCSFTHTFHFLCSARHSATAFRKRSKNKLAELFQHITWITRWPCLPTKLTTILTHHTNFHKWIMASSHLS